MRALVILGAALAVSACSPLVIVVRDAPARLAPPPRPPVNPCGPVNCYGRQVSRIA